MGLAVKKTLSHPKAAPQARALFKEQIDEYKRQGKPIIYIDESGFAKDMPRCYGWSKKGHRCHGIQDWLAKGRTNVIGALWNNALLNITLFEGNINSDIFHTWLTEALLPCTPKRAVIVMDNAPFHKRHDIVKAIENAGHQLEFLPTYSPDFNPIEHLWAKAKARRRRLQCDVDTLFAESL